MEHVWSRPGRESPQNPFADGEAIREFLERYLGGERNRAGVWMEYVTSPAFLDAAWEPEFTALLLEKVTQWERTMPPSREFLYWLNVVYQFTEPSEEERFAGLESILRIAEKAPRPQRPQHDAFAILQSVRDYRRLVRLAQAGRWDREAMERLNGVLDHYVSACIRERCGQRGSPYCERHPAGLRLVTHFFRREDIPPEAYRAAWQRLDLKSAVMGRAGVLYGPLRALALERVPGIEAAGRENILQLNRALDGYLARLKAHPEREPEESAAFFRSELMQSALPAPRFLERQLLTWSKWRRDGVGEGLLRAMLDYYRAHPGLPRVEEAVSALEETLRSRRVKAWNREDAQAEHRTPPRVSVRPFLRHWLNTAFYTARSLKGEPPLLEYLQRRFPCQPSWSAAFAEEAEPVLLRAGDRMVELTFFPLHPEYRVNGERVYRPCLSWEEAAAEEALFLLLPITAAPVTAWEEVVSVLLARLEDTAIPEEDRPMLARALAGQVCRRPVEEHTGRPHPPEEVLPLERSMEGNGRLYTAVWYEEEGPVTIFRQTGSGRRVAERLEPEPGADRLAAAERRLEEFTAFGRVDLSGLKELPWKIFYTTTPSGGEEECLTHIDLLRPDPREDAWALLEKWEEMEDIPRDLEAALEKVRRAAEEEPEGPAIPPEALVTEEALSALLERFARDGLERLELEWSEGRLVLRRDRGRYACLYFENSYGGGERWYALLSDPECYRTADGEEVERLPFGMGTLAGYALFPSAGALLRDMDLVLDQLGRGRLGGSWMWSCEVSLQDSLHKLRMAQQKLGGVPACRGQNYLLAKFVMSRFPCALERVDLEGERTVRPLWSGSYGQAAEGLVRFMQGKLARLRLTWSFPGRGDSHLVLLRDRGRYMLLWLQDAGELALACAAGAPVRFMGYCAPAGLVHRDLKRIRNWVDLILDDIDRTGLVLERPGEFVPVSMPYPQVRGALVQETE